MCCRCRVLLIISLLPLLVYADEAQVRIALEKYPITISSISPAPKPLVGFFEVITVDSNIFYISIDGQYIIQGNIVNVASSIDLTDQKLATLRAKQLANIGEDKTIVFAPKKIKHKVFVFTDIDCGYCRKLHQDIDAYLALGIKVQYLLYPRLGQSSYDKAVTVWCSLDRARALTQAKQGIDLPKKTCANPVDEHLRLGQNLGLVGTPMIVSEKGTIFPGYLPPQNLFVKLQND